MTFEPTHYSSILPSHSKASPSTTNPSSPPSLQGMRSRVVNAKRTDLSKGVRRKIEKDNCTPFGNLRGWNKSEYNVNGGGGKLTRAFFGHTRFATSSKATFEGTHPHQWCGRRDFMVYPLRVSSSFVGGGSASSLIGVENYITHNGDFEFYKVNGKYYDVEVMQLWLEKVLGVPMPATVDSAAIAGVIDLLRCQGCFALSARYALCLSLPSSKVDPEPAVAYPTIQEYEDIAEAFESSIDELLNNGSSLESISSDTTLRAQLTATVVALLLKKLDELPSSAWITNGGDASSSKNRTKGASSSAIALSKFVSMHAEDTTLPTFVRATVDAFFDNDLLHTTRLFLEHAKGSFGLCVASSLDAHRQVCLAARGQTASVAFYPKKGLICYGSEQAAVKAGLNYENPGGNLMAHGDNEGDNAVRLDLDDLGGEICLLDWGYSGDADPAVSPPNRNLTCEKLMNGGVNVVLLHQSKAFKEYSQISKRLTLLENNEFIRPLLNDSDDPVLSDIKDIPRICANIQEGWHDVVCYDLS